MKFTKLEITNFLAITDAEIDLADRGLVLIQGKNSLDSSAESNGAGKSTIADALSWCLFGVTARGSTGDDVINHAAGKGTRVSVRLTDGSSTYLVERHRKHKTHKNSLRLTQLTGLSEIDMTKGTDKLTQAELDEIIGCSHEVFTGAIYAGQERMPDLPAMTDKALKMLIEEAAGVNVLENAHVLAREGLRAAKLALDNAVLTLDHALNQEQDLAARVHDNKESSENWAKLQRDKVERKSSEARVLITRVKERREKLDEDAQAKRKARLVEIETLIAGVSGENTEKTRLATELANLDADMRALTRDQKVHQSRVASAEHDLQSVSERVGEPCHECGRPLTQDELKTATENAEKRVASETAALQDVTARLNKVSAAKEAAAKDLSAFEKTMTDLSAISAERGVLVEECQKYEAEMVAISGDIQIAGRLKKEIEELRAEKNPFETRHPDLVAKHNTALQKLVDYRAEQKAKEELLNIETEVVKVFGPAGVRAHILDEVTPFLNGQTAQYLEVLSDGNITATWSTITLDAKGNPKEKFQIEVANVTGGKGFKLLSGGEKRKVRIAAALALQDLVATRARKPIELFIGDEIDDALDAAGIERLTQVLESKARERGSVFIISHNEIRDMVKQVLEIEKTSAGTVIREVAA